MIDVLLQILTICGVVANTGILTSIYFKLGRYDEKHDSHERRIDILEKRRGLC